MLQPFQFTTFYLSVNLRIEAGDLRKLLQTFLGDLLYIIIHMDFSFCSCSSSQSAFNYMKRYENVKETDTRLTQFNASVFVNKLIIHVHTCTPLNFLNYNFNRYKMMSITEKQH